MGCVQAKDIEAQAARCEALGAMKAQAPGLFPKQAPAPAVGSSEDQTAVVRFSFK